MLEGAQSNQLPAFAVTKSLLRVLAILGDHAWCSLETTLVNDGQNFELELRGNRFEGGTVDGLELVVPSVSSAEPPDLYQFGLCACVIEWAMPVRVVFPGAGTTTMDLRAHLTLGDPTPRGGLDRGNVALTLQLSTGIVATEPQESMEDALLEPQRRLPAGVHLVACISCAFSDYHPVGSAFIGSMACFRDAKDSYRVVGSKVALFQVWDQRSGFVQETFCCKDYEQRRTGAGYRG